MEGAHSALAASRRPTVQPYRTPAGHEQDLLDAVLQQLQGLTIGSTDAPMEE
ncbi:MAG: hypothetical protein MHM6MM_006680 [Cercozoa sp. M6MM]